jgi:hypothetical protein
VKRRLPELATPPPERLRLGLDVLLFADGLYRERGAVLGTRANCAALMRGGEEFPPLVRGLGLTPLPRPEKLHFSVGSPIDMARYRGREQDPEVLRSARTRVARSLERLIAELGPHRARSRGQGALRRVLNRL